jgi:hypothetical protein
MIIHNQGAVPTTRQTSATVARQAHDGDQPRLVRCRTSQKITSAPSGNPRRAVTEMTAP